MIRFLFFQCCAAILLSFVQVHAIDGVWSTFHLQDINGPVKAIVRSSAGEVYVGGSFTEAGGVAASNIARWHNGVWSALGTGAYGGTQSAVEALAIAADGTLYAGGLFSTAGGKTANNIAAWDGQSWRSVGSGSNGRITSLATGDNGTLYAGGQFTAIGAKSAGGVARWSGGQWTSLGTGLRGGELIVNALCFYEDNLYAGGNFTDAGGVAVSNIARWDGQNWQAVGQGIPEYTAVVYTIAVHSGQLYAAGSFALPGEITTANVRSWNGTGWSNRGYFNGPVHTLAFSGATLIAAGDFTCAGTSPLNSALVPAAHIAATSGSGWSSPGGGTDGPVYTLLTGETTVVAGGDFSVASGVVMHNIAHWSGTLWSPVGGIPSTSINGTVHALAFAPNGDLYAGGSFTTAGATTANSIARWDGRQWHALGTGVNGTVQVIAVDSKGMVYAGGDFTMAGSTHSNAIARWNGTAWESMNTNASYTRIHALVINEVGMLYAGGIFSSIGSTSANNVARWNGGEWSQMNMGVNGTVNAMAYRNGRLYIGGDFSETIGGVLNGVAEWDGTQWLPLKGGVDGTVLTLAVAPNGRLYAGGDFTIPARGVTRIGMWDGSQWNSMGKGANHDISSIAVDSSGAVYVAGLFTLAGDINAEKTAVWSDGAWNPLGAGIGGTPVALAASHTRIFAGGNFSMAGGMPSHNLAVWLPCAISPTISAEGSPVLCSGESVRLTVPGSYSSYRWNTGATTPTITVSTSGSYSVVVTNSTGCSAVAPAVAVTVHSIALQLVADVSICAGDSVRLSAGGADSYLWTPAEGLSCTTCAAPFAKPAAGTVYTVEAMSSGCKTTATVSVTVHPAPARPVVERTGSLLSCTTPAASYQWLRNNVPVPGATDSIYIVSAGDFGWFSVRTTDGNGCRAVSDSLFVDLSTAAGESAEQPQLLLSGSGRLYTVQCTPSAPCPIALVVVDLLGRTVYASQQSAAARHTVPIGLPAAAPGVYIVHVSAGSERWVRTLVVQ